MKRLILILLLCLVSFPAFADEKELVYDRVMKSGEIRCGYWASPGVLEVEPNSGEISGLLYDYMNLVAKNLGLKVNWVEEIGRGDFIPALQNDRIDAYCTALSVNAERAREVDFTDPYYFDAFELFVRKDDNRFDNKASAVNSKGITIVAKEGDIFAKIASRFFPKAKLLELPQLSSDTDPLLYVDTEKADIVLTTEKIADRYIKNNPDKIRKVKLSRPYIFSFGSVAVKADEYRFRRMLDLAGMEIQGTGQYDALFEKHDPKGFFRKRALPYHIPQGE